MKKSVLLIALWLLAASTGSQAQSGQAARKSSATTPGSSSGLQQSNKGGATSGGPSGGAGNIGRQRGTKSGTSAPLTGGSPAPGKPTKSSKP